MSKLPREARVKAKRRVDYRPPAFLVDDVALEFDLDPDATDVTATYAFRRNPAAADADRHAPLVLDGEHQAGLCVALEGAALPRDRIAVATSTLTVRRVPDAGTLTVRSTTAPSRSRASTSPPTCFARSASPKASGASRTSPTVRMCSRAIA